MNRLLSHKFWHEYTTAEWMCTKILVAYYWLHVIMEASVDHERIPYPSGIFSIINGSFLLSEYTVVIFFILGLILVILYLAERWMAVTTLCMFLLSLFLFSLEESSGVLNRSGLYTMIFLAQAIAYYRNAPGLSRERVQFPIQIIAAGYILAGISKLQNSGLHWITDSPLMSIQVLKGYTYAYFNTGNLKDLQQGIKNADFILAHKYIVETLCASSLFLELFAWLAVRNKATAFVYGLMLFAMHMGILYFMNVLIVSIYYPMLIFMINPLYLFYVAANKAYTRIKNSPSGAINAAIKPD
jgi:hypothetical protein